MGNQIYHGQVTNAPCAGCHGDNAKGTPLGPDLTTSTWLWGDGSLPAIERIVTDGCGPLYAPNAPPAALWWRVWEALRAL